MDGGDFDFLNIVFRAPASLDSNKEIRVAHAQLFIDLDGERVEMSLWHQKTSCAKDLRKSANTVYDGRAAAGDCVAGKQVIASDPAKAGVRSNLQQRGRFFRRRSPCPA